MHEMSLIEGIFRILEDQARTHGFEKVKTVWLEIGTLSSAEPESMAFCFEAIKPGTLAENAKLEILRSPGQAWCLNCDKVIEIASRVDPCPDCGGHKLQVTGGEELKVKELEVE